MSEQIFVYLEVWPDLSFHLYIEDEEYYGMVDYEEIKAIIQRYTTKQETGGSEK